MPHGALIADLGLPPDIPFLNWPWDDLLFLILAALAGVYALAGAVIVAATQVLVYIGAISILILFAIMLTQTKSGPAELVFHRQAWAGALAAVVLGLLMMVAMINTPWPLAGPDRLPAMTNQVAMLLFEDPLYVFALQVIAVLLTAAVIGGVFLAKREVSADPAERLQSATLDRLRPPRDAVLGEGASAFSAADSAGAGQ